MFKQLPFRWAFTRFHSNLEFRQGEPVDSFGIEQLEESFNDERKMASQVAVLDYQNGGDFIIELKTNETDDRLILANITPKATLEKTIAAVEGRIAGKKPTKMENMANLYIPVLNFDLSREYTELYGKPVHTDSPKVNDTLIEIAAQFIRFRLDETGAVLQSEGGMWGGGTIPKNLVFDGPFLILLKRRESKQPYFALWIGNRELLVSTPEPKRTENLPPGWTVGSR